MLKEFATGVATINLPLSSKVCSFVPIELFPFQHGEVTNDTKRIEDKGVDASGKAYSVSVAFGTSINAEWMGFGSNRTTPPNIRRKHRVKLYRLGDSNKFYWEDMGLDGHLMRQETVRMVYSNTKDENTTELTPENSYYTEVCTHTGQITTQTSKSNGEKFAYTQQINARGGKVVTEDDVGNGHMIDSNEKLIHLYNQDGSDVKVIKKNIELTCDASIIAKCKDFKVEASNSTSIQTKAYSLKSETDRVSASTSYTLTSAQIGITGATRQTGTFTVLGATAITGATNVLGALTNNGINVGSTHRHPNGNPLTGTPQ